MVNANPLGLGLFTFNLRLPGQYFDAETNNHYNYFRDYSPEIGRYIESDPIGLRGGLNTYLYVQADPLRYVDPMGQESSSQRIGNAILKGLTKNTVAEASKQLGQAIGSGLQGKTGQQGCYDACTEKCLQIIDQASVYFRNEVLGGCLEGCVPECKKCP